MFLVLKCLRETNNVTNLISSSDILNKKENFLLTFTLLYKKKKHWKTEQRKPVNDTFLSHFIFAPQQTT